MDIDVWRGAEQLFPAPRDRCDGDMLIVFADGAEFLIHDLSPEHANSWRLGWGSEIVKIRYPVDCDDPHLPQRYHFDDNHTWYVHRWEQLRTDGVRVSRMVTGLTRRDSRVRAPARAPLHVFTES